MSEQLRFEAYDTMLRLRTIKRLANSIVHYVKSDNTAMVEKYAGAIIETSDGGSGWGYSQEVNREDWERLKAHAQGGGQS